jgi:addiction module HigA family antidote
MTSAQEFRPDWVSAPGDTIADVLQERHLSVTEFARLLGYSVTEVSELLQGRATITIAVARQLQRVLGSSMEFWMSRDFQYREDAAKLHVDEKAWVAEFPIGDMIRFGWLRPVPRPADEATACLRFFGVHSVDAWREEYAGLQEMVAFRTSRSLDSRPAAVAAWLRQGQIEGEAISAGTWDSRRFEESLAGIRRLTRQKDPGRFLPELQRLCAESGVAVVVVRSPNGCRASGATRFLTPAKALMMFSFRYLTDDQFWFTFFHEAGHLLLHGEKGFFIESSDTPTSSEEEEANEFAAGALIPLEFRAALLGLSANAREIIRFAVRVGVSPGVVVGQLQHYGKVGHGQLNSLKRRFSWEG